jgi:anti-sigma regulatory factor (Ser/Thr protein kinase)
VVGVGVLLVRHEPASASVVRRRIADELIDIGISGEAVDRVVLVASELVGNAIQHARPSAAAVIEVSWDIDGPGVIVRVSDPSDESPRPRQAAEDEPAGRGLTIVAAMSDDWGYQRSGRGKQVWARVPVRKSSVRR